MTSRWKSWFGAPTTGQLLKGAAAAWFGAAVFCLDLFKPSFEAVPRATVNGEIARVGISFLDEKGESQALDLHVSGYPMRFRASPALFEEILLGTIPDDLVEGTTVRLIVPREQLSSPPAPSWLETIFVVQDGIPTVKIDAIELECRTVMSLDDTRRRYEESRREDLLVTSLCTTLGLLFSVPLLRRIFNHDGTVASIRNAWVKSLRRA